MSPPPSQFFPLNREGGTANDPHDARFMTTHWSVIAAATSGVSAVARKALEELCQKYWFPVYAYVRRRGHSPADAEDIVQEFFRKLIQRNDLARLDKADGKFRAFLLAAVNHLMSDLHDYTHALKRGGGSAVVPLDGQFPERRYQEDLVCPVDPAELYDREWALMVLEKARVRLREEYEALGKEKLYQLLIASEPGAGMTLSYAEIGERLCKTESAIRTAACRFRMRYGDLVRAEIAQTVSSPSEIDEEVRYLLTVVGRSNAAE